MKIILVAEEPLVRQQLQRMLSSYAEIEIMGSLPNAREASLQVSALQPDVLFLDLHRQEQSGMDAVEWMRQACPSVDLVFVSAHGEYALQAFELNAVDYLLKPLQQSRLDKTIQRLLEKRMPAQVVMRQAAPCRIHCLQFLRFQHAGQPLAIPKWRTAKAQELFAFLLHHRGQIVLKETLLELLFPDLDQKQATSQLYTLIYFVRQTLKQLGLDVHIRNLSIQGGYVLDTSKVRIDVDEWEEALRQIDGAELTDRHSELRELLAQYEGDYLQEHGYWWTADEGERLRQLWCQHSRSLVRFYEDAGMTEEAVAVYEKLQDFDPYCEEDALALIELYATTGRSQQVERHYRKVEDLFSNELEIDVPEQLVDWYEQWSCV